MSKKIMPKPVHLNVSTVKAGRMTLTGRVDDETLLVVVPSQKGGYIAYFMPHKANVRKSLGILKRR